MKTLPLDVLASVTGGFVPDGSPKGGASPAPHNPFHYNNPISGNGESKDPHCENYKKWNNPTGTAVTTGGGLVQYPMKSCWSKARPAAPGH